VFTECERVAASSVTSTLAPQVGFTCQACGAKVLANAASAERRGHVDCLVPDCGARHTVTRQEDGSFHFALSGRDVACQSCGASIFVRTRQFVPEHVFACAQCGRRHKLLDQVWRYAAEVEAPSGPS
jgi:DNA-directed RNA polymerase subunit RPC12/RpoP